MTDVACAIAQGEVSVNVADRRLVAVYATPLSGVLLHWARELGFDTVLLEPDVARHDDPAVAQAARLIGDPGSAGVDELTDVVVTDHHRDDLGEVMASLLAAHPRWIGIIGSPRHEAPHVAALRERGVDEPAIASVHRPIGLDIGSRTPPEIALSVLAGLLADRNGRAA